MNLKDLNNISIEDLKNIDWNKAKARLLERPDLLINASLVIITVIVVVSVYNMSAQKVKFFKTQIAELEERTIGLQKLEARQKEYQTFTASIPKQISENRLIELLSEIALRQNIKIISFSPAQKKDAELARLTKVVVNVTSEYYADIIRFIHDIENSSYSIRIGKWSGELTTSDKNMNMFGRRERETFAGNTQDTNRAPLIAATVEIESIELKNE